MQQLGNPLCGPGRSLQLTDDLTQRAKRAAHYQAVKHEGRQFAAGDAPGNHVHAAHPQHYPDCAQHQQDDQGNQPGTLYDTLARGGESLFDRVCKALPVLLLMVVSLDGFDLPQRFGHIAADIGNPVLALTRQAAHPASENQNRRQHQR